MDKAPRLSTVATRGCLVAECQAGAGAETGADPVARFYRETVALTDPVAVRAQLESGVCVRHFTPITITTAAPRRQQQGGQLGE